MQREIENLEFVQGVNIESIDSFKNNGTKYSLIIDKSCGEISSSKAFVDIGTARRHFGLSILYIKHNLFYQANLGETLSSRWGTLFSSILFVVWCKSVRLVHNWDSDQSYIIGIETQHLLLTDIYWLTCRHDQTIDYVIVQKPDPFPQNFISQTDWSSQKFWTMNT